MTVTHFYHTAFKMHSGHQYTIKKHQISFHKLQEWNSSKRKYICFNDSTDEWFEWRYVVDKNIESIAHLHPNSINKLFKRSDKWNQILTNSVEKTLKNFNTCMISGKPKTSNKFRIFKGHQDFKSSIEFNIVF